MDGQFFVEITTAVIAILGAIITYVVVPYFRTKNALVWVEVAVSAAEQIFSEPKMGEQKKDYVLQFLKRKGVKLTKEQLEVLIEAAVRELT